jgi:hypothetical protein
LNSSEGKRSNYLELEDKLEDEGFEFEVDAIKNIMYFVAGKSNSHELLDEMLAFGI